MSAPFEVRRGATRGALRNTWLDARMSFSFGDRVDPQRPRLGPLLALNEDRVQPDSGFPMHPHRDLEILMLPRRGSVEHLDSQGRLMRVRPGELQWMRAGKGIRHRQWNVSAREVDHHFQIWLEPSRPGLEPTVERRPCDTPAAGQWRVLVSSRPDDAGALDVGVDLRLALGAVAPGADLALPARAGGLYLHLMCGQVALHADGLGRIELDGGDAIAFFDGVPALRLQAASAGELLRFDTAAVDRRTGLPAAPTLNPRHMKQELAA